MVFEVFIDVALGGRSGRFLFRTLVVGVVYFVIGRFCLRYGRNWKEGAVFIMFLFFINMVF